MSALDVAKGIKMVYKEGGVYNAADGVNPRFIDMVEAMTANAEYEAHDAPSCIMGGMGMEAWKMDSGNRPQLEPQSGRTANENAHNQWGKTCRAWRIQLF